MNTLKSSREKEKSCASEPYRFTKRIGSTTFHVSVRFSETSRETADDKIARMIAGAVLLRVVVYHKGKKSKMLRRDREYGTARWGTAKDIKPFIDPVFKNNVILTGTEYLTMNTRPKNPANARNLNCCVIGGSGSGKTRFWLTPNLLQAHSS